MAGCQEEHGGSEVGGVCCWKVGPRVARKSCGDAKLAAETPLSDL